MSLIQVLMLFTPIAENYCCCTPNTCAGSPLLSSPPPVSPVLRPTAAVAPTPGAGWQLLSPSTRPHRAALLSRQGFGQGLLSLCTCTPPYAPRPVSSSLALGVLFRVSVLLLSQEALTGALPTHLLYEPALVKFYCAAAASALTETIWMQKRTQSTGAPICKSP